MGGCGDVGGACAHIKAFDILHQDKSLWGAGGLSDMPIFWGEQMYKYMNSILCTSDCT